MVVLTVRVNASRRRFDRTVVLKALLFLGFLMPTLASGISMPAFWYWALEDYQRTPVLQLYGVHRSPLTAFGSEPLTGIADSSLLRGDAFVLASNGSPKLVVLNRERMGTVYVLDGNLLPQLLTSGARNIWPFSWNSVLVLTESGLLQERTLDGEVATFSTSKIPGGLPQNILAMARNRESELILLDATYTVHVHPMNPETHVIHPGTKKIVNVNFAKHGAEPILLAQGNHIWFGRRSLTDVSLHFIDLQTNHTHDVTLALPSRNFFAYAIDAHGSLLAKPGVDRVVLSGNGGGITNPGYYSLTAVENWLGFHDRPIDPVHSRIFAVPTTLTPWMLNPLNRPRLTEQDVRAVLGRDLRTRYRDRADLASLPLTIESDLFARYLSESPVAQDLLAPVRSNATASAEFRNRFSLNVLSNPVVRVNGRTNVSVADFISFVTKQHLDCGNSVAASTN